MACGVPNDVEESKTYYIACARCREVKAYDGSILTKDDTIAWLGYDDGYSACQRNKSSAHHFKTAEEIPEKSLKHDGMPWFFQLKPGTLEIFRVEVETKRRKFRGEACDGERKIGEATHRRAVIRTIP